MTTPKTWAVAALALLIPAAPLRAQDKPADKPVEQPAEKPAEKTAEKKSSPVSAGSDGFSLQNESGDFRVQIRGYVQFDGRFFSGDERRARHRHLPPAARAPHRAGLGRKVLRLQHHARLRGRHRRPPGRLVGRQALAQAARARRQVQGAGRPRAAPVRSPTITFVERAFPTAAGSEPRRRRSAPRRAGGRGVWPTRPASSTARPTGAASTSTSNDSKDLAGRDLPLAFQEGEVRAQGPRLRRSPARTGKQSGALAGLPLRRAAQHLHHPHGDHR